MPKIPVVNNDLPEAKKYLDEIYQANSVPDNINSRIEFMAKRTGYTHFHSGEISLDLENYRKADEKAKSLFLNTLERAVISEETNIRKWVDAA